MTLTEAERKRVGAILDDKKKHMPGDMDDRGISRDVCRKAREDIDDGERPGDIAEDCGYERHSLSKHLRGECHHFDEPARRIGR